ncbi:radical SAM protein [Thermodesulfobacteriota bacterium]
MKIAPQEELLIKLRDLHVPKDANLELTYRCNLKCVHCYLEEDTTGELTTDEVCSIIDQLADAGTIEICFTGGEALLREDFFTLVARARQRHMAVSLITNGTLIDKSVVDLFKGYHFASVLISLYGVTAETHDSVTRVEGSFAKTFRAIHLLRDHGLKVQIKTPIMKQNADEVALVSDFCDEIGAALQIGPVIGPTTKGSRRPLQYRLSDEELERYVKWDIASGRVPRGYVGMCNAGFSNVSISAHGKVYPCIVLRREAGDLRRQSLAEIWNGSATLRSMRAVQPQDFRECDQCEHLHDCSRCPGQSHEEEGDMFLPLKEACRITRLRNELGNGDHPQSVTERKPGCPAKTERST